MQTTFALAALASVAFAYPQIQARSDVPTGCSTSYDGKFHITVLNGSSTVTKRDLLQARSSSCDDENLLTATLSNSTLTDAKGRIGEIVSNHQFQFDPAPGQDGALYTSGWSICSNGSLAIHGTTIFYSCQSGTFSNLYDESIASYCKPVYINVLACSSSTATGTAAAGAVTQIGDGQIQAATAVTQISDGQLQIATGVPVTQISDGQLQAGTTAAKATTTKASTKATTTAAGVLVSQISDGQIQVATAKATTSVTTKASSNTTVTTSTPTTSSSTSLTTSTSSTSTTTAAAATVSSSAGKGLYWAGSLSSAIIGLAAVLLL